MISNMSLAAPSSNRFRRLRRFSGGLHVVDLVVEGLEKVEVEVGREVELAFHPISVPVAELEC